MGTTGEEPERTVSDTKIRADRSLGAGQSGSLRIQADHVAIRNLLN
jgi:hypothetical protein